MNSNNIFKISIIYSPDTPEDIKLPIFAWLHLKSEYIVASKIRHYVTVTGKLTETQIRNFIKLTGGLEYFLIIKGGLTVESNRKYFSDLKYQRTQKYIKRRNEEDENRYRTG